MRVITFIKNKFRARKADNYEQSLTPHQKKIDAILTVVAIVCAIIILLPLLMTFNLAFKTDGEFTINKLGIVQNITFKNFVIAWDKMNVIKNTFDTILYTAIACFINIFIIVLASFPISRKHFKGADFLSGFLMLTMLLPTTMIATMFILQYVFGIYGTPLAILYIWALGGVQFNSFMAIGFYKQIPKDLDEAAVIDGCGYFRYIITMTLPLIKPVIATILIFKVISCWNDFLSPFLYAGTSFRTLSTGLFNFQGEFASQWNQLSAAVFLVATPMVIMYLFLQKWVIGGITSGALKG